MTEGVVSRSERGDTGPVRASVGDLPQHGKLVYLAFMKTQDDVGRLGDDLFKEGRRTAEEALLQEAHKIGCPTVSVYLTAGPLLSWVRERADWAAGSICDTYNADLVNAILRIIADIPTANRWVIAHHLGQWEASRQGWKSSQVAITEAFEISSYVRLQFWEFNKVKEPKCYFGYSLQCQVCQDIAKRNPYTLAEAEAIGLPHVNCLDQWHVEGETVDCDQLWLGQ